MRIAFHYGAMFPVYLGGILKNAARRLGIDCYSSGPNLGRWISDAPEEPGWRHDVMLSAGRIDCPVDADVLLNVDTGEGHFCVPTNGVPVITVLSEGNPGEYQRHRVSNPKVVWSCMPFKEAGRRESDLRYLEWGYDESHIRGVPPNSNDRFRAFDFYQRGSAHAPRLPIWTEATRRYGSRALTGVPVSREQWGNELYCAKTTLCDHDASYLSGRVVDAMAAGCLVLAKQSPEMTLLAPRGYAVIPWNGLGIPPPEAIFPLVDTFLKDEARRLEVCSRAFDAVKTKTWTNQLLRILGSAGFHL